MRTSLNMPRSLLDEAMQLTRAKTKTALIISALEDLVRRNKIAEQVFEISARQALAAASFLRELNKLVMESPHRCLRTALQTGQNCLGEWRKNLSIIG